MSPLSDDLLIIKNISREANAPGQQANESSFTRKTHHSSFHRTEMKGICEGQNGGEGARVKFVPKPLSHLTSFGGH